MEYRDPIQGLKVNRGGLLPGAAVMPEHEQPDIVGTDDNQTLRAFVDILRNNLKIIAGTTATTLLVGVLFLLAGPKTYIATAKIEVDAKAANLLSISPASTTGGSELGIVETQLEILGAEHIARRVVDKLDLSQDLVPGPRAEGPDARLEKASDDGTSQDPIPADADNISDHSLASRYNVMRQLRKSLKIERVGLSSVLEVNYRGDHPEAAARIVNAVVDAYLEDEVAAKQRMIQQSVESLQKSVIDNESKLRATEEQLQAFMAKHKLGSDAIVDSSEQRELTEYMQQLAIARANAAAARAREMETQSASRDYEVAQAQVRFLEQGLEQLKEEMSERRKAAVGLAKLNQESKSTASLHGLLLTKLRELETQQKLKAPIARVIFYATVPPSPAFPRPTLTLAVALAGGLGFGTLLAVAFEKSRNTFRGVTELEHAFNIPVVATFPLQTSDEATAVAENRRTSALQISATNAIGIHSFWPRAKDSEVRDMNQALFQMKDALLTKRAGKRGLVVALISAKHGDGRTTLSKRFAAYAQSTGVKTLLIDADLRGTDDLTNHLDADVHTLGDVLGGTVTLEDACAKSDDIGGAALLAAPKRNTCELPMELLASEEFSNLVNVAAQSFSLVLIDTPPLVHFVDASAVVRASDMAFFVIAYDLTSGQEVNSCLKLLGPQKAKILGFILNKWRN